MDLQQQLDVVTLSIPTAAALIAAGHPIKRISVRSNSVAVVFGPEAEPALVRFRLIKQQLDEQVEAAKRSA